MKVIHDPVQKSCDNLFIFIFDIFWKNGNISELHDPICLNFLEIIDSYIPKIFFFLKKSTLGDNLVGYT